MGFDRDSPGVNLKAALRLFREKSLKLEVISGIDKGKSVLLSGDNLNIGTGDLADFRIRDRKMSEIHCRLYRDRSWWILQDLGSYMGCFLQGKLTDRTAVFPGESIRLGDTTFTLNYDESLQKNVSETGKDTEPTGSIRRNGEWFELPRIIAHELRHYLEFLDLGVDHLENDPEIGRKHGSEIRNLKLASRKIDELVQALRDGMIQPEMQSIELTELVWEQLALLEPVMDGQGINLKTDIRDSAIMVMGDPNQLSCCIINILKNAMEACSPDDTIRVKLRSERSRAIIEVFDSGCGMEPEVQYNMWTPLFTTKQDGNGLGAFLCRSIISRHQGKIKAESALGSGSLIRVELQCHDL